MHAAGFWTPDKSIFNAVFKAHFQYLYLDFCYGRYHNEFYGLRIRGRQLASVEASGLFVVWGLGFQKYQSISYGKHFNPLPSRLSPP